MTRHLAPLCLAAAALALAAAASPAPKQEEAEPIRPAQGLEPYTVSAGGSYTAFPAEILSRMRAALVAQTQPDSPPRSRPVPGDTPAPAH